MTGYIATAVEQAVNKNLQMLLSLSKGNRLKHKGKS